MDMSCARKQLTALRGTTKPEAVAAARASGSAGGRTGGAGMAVWADSVDAGEAHLIMHWQHLSYTKADDSAATLKKGRFAGRW